jgi:SAM-dependent methyltransferase
VQSKDYEIMHALEARFWWFAGMRHITRALLKRHISGSPRAILDVGCGTGINLLWMLQQFPPELIVGCDYSPVALGWCQETLQASGSASARVRPVLCRGDVRKLPFSDRTFDLATSLDVLDLFPPIGDDTRAMAELHRVLRPGGLALVREPAYQWLLCGHDVAFETQHRYSTGELREKMSSAGFQVIQTTYANTLLFPLAAMRRLLRMIGIANEGTDTKPWPKAFEWLNLPFTRCLAWEARWLARGLGLPCGLSAICIGRRRD